MIQPPDWAIKQAWDEATDDTPVGEIRERARRLARGRPSAQAVEFVLQTSRSEAQQRHGAGAWDVADVMDVLKKIGLVE